MTEKEFLVGVNSDHQKMKRYDSGHGSGLDVDMVDGKHASELGGGGGGDMLKAVYDMDDDGVVDNSEKLEGSTKAQVQDHAPKEHGNEAHNPDFLSSESDPTVDTSLKGITLTQVRDHDPKTHIHDDRYYTETEINAWKHDDEVEGHGGGFNADKVDGLHASELGGSLPSGLIVMWSGLKANIPSGWVLCDGTGGTPDLRNRFIYGVGDGEEAGGTGGSETHDHDAHPSQDLVSSQADVGASKRGTTADTLTQIVHKHTVTLPQLTHNAKDHKPPYFKLCFIMKV